MSSNDKSVTCRVWIAASWVYLVILFTWLGFNILTGDRFIVIALVGFLAVYLFAPLILVLPAAVVCRNRWLGAGFLVGTLAFIWIWGAQFIPNTPQDPGDQPALRVMTYNVLAWHNHFEQILDTIQTEEADIVFLQELNTDLAKILEQDLVRTYPYQEFDPADNPTGIGMISKYPIRPTGEYLPGRWLGDPQVLQLAWHDQLVLVVNFHMYSTTGVFPLRRAESSFHLRENQARLLLDLARRSDSVIMAGDANSAPTSDAYRIITSELSDAYRQAGFGLGHTFPGSDIPESDRPHIGDWYVPRWLARIDYVFYSPDWSAVSAHTAKLDGVSDHRGVVAELIKQ
jgi:endonuclease/exonuclease/phosphatase (EEP) superfamily protein YafD